MCSLWSKQILLTWSLLKGELSQAQEQVSLLNESGSKQWAEKHLEYLIDANETIYHIIDNKVK